MASLAPRLNLDGYADARHAGRRGARQIRALDTARRTRLIALTASAFSENKVAALDSGCDDFVSKPVPAATVLEKTAQHLGVRYCYAETVLVGTPETSQPILTPALIAQAPSGWQYALTQAALDLDDEAIFSLIAQLPAEQYELAAAVEACVKSLSYKRMLQVLQEAEAVSS